MSATLRIKEVLAARNAYAGALKQAGEAGEDGFVIANAKLEELAGGNKDLKTLPAERLETMTAELHELTEELIDKTPQVATQLSAPAVPSVPKLSIKLRKTRKGVVHPDEENTRRILLGDSNLEGIVRFDEFSGEMILTRPITTDPSLVGDRDLPRPWIDSDTVTLQTHIQRLWVPRLGREKIEATLDMIARQNCSFHPVREYLQSLSWDGMSRLYTWLRDYVGATKQPEKYLAAVGSAWLISGVARILNPGCKADCMLVLEGSQGIYKSTMLRTLAGARWFSDSLPADLSHKDARDHLRGKWIIEMPELAQFRRAEIETVKSFLSRQEEQYRPSYGHHELKFPRQCIFAGSTNKDTYLVDDTGNRRFWTVACNDIDLKAVVRDRDQLWAEAAVRYRSGARWWLTKEESALAEVEAGQRIAHDPWTARVAEVVKGILTPDVTPGEVMARMDLPDSERHDRNAGRIGTILQNLEWVRARRDKTRGQTYLPPAAQAAANAAERAENEKLFNSP